jgi:hypothetical protein
MNYRDIISPRTYSNITVGAIGTAVGIGGALRSCSTSTHEHHEVITISVFILFAILFLKEKLAWNYPVAFVFLGIGAFFAFAFKTSGSVV